MKNSIKFYIGGATLLCLIGFSMYQFKRGTVSQVPMTFSLPSGIEVKYLPGLIQGITDDIIMVESSSLTHLGNTVTYQVHITDKTMIVYAKQQSSGPFIEIPATLNSLKINDSIIVQTAEDIRNQTSFDAVKIMDLESPVIPTSAASSTSP